MDIKQQQRESLENLYREAFQPDDYVHTYYRSLDAEVEFFLRNLHHFFAALSDGDYTNEEKSSEANTCQRVLEIGSGPIPISMISASRRSEWIVCSDFLEINRQRMAQWLARSRQTAPGPGGEHNKDDDDGDGVWLSFSRYVAQLERPDLLDDDDGSWLLDRVRHSVRSVVPCNVFLDDPLMGYQDQDGNGKGDSGNALFDVIITTLCLEFASLTAEEYVLAVANVASLLRPSGYFIIQGALDNSHYWHNQRKFPSVPLNRAMVEAAVSEAGCQLVEWKELKRCCPREDKPADHSAVFYCLARKMYSP